MDAKIRFLFSLKLETLKAERQERQKAAWHFLERGDWERTGCFFLFWERWGKGWGDVVVGSVKGFVGGLLGWTYS